MNYFSRPKWRLLPPLFVAFLLCGMVIAGFALGQDTDRSPLVAGALVCVALLGLDAYVASVKWDRAVMRQALGGRRLSSLRCSLRQIPPYRYVDMYRACERLADSHDGLTLDVGSEMPLSFIVGNAGFRRMGKPLSTKFITGPGESEWFPNDRYWAVKLAPGAARRDTIVRLRQIHDEYRGSQILLEVASNGEPEALIDQITDDALKHSIYRGHVVRIQTGEGLRDELGTEAYGQEMRIGFCTDKEVTEEDIILDDKIRDIIERNVFSFHRLRERLSEFGIPQRRGLLLFGPPGTGKTYACRFMYSKLDGVTAIIVTGQALLKLKSVCELARLLQPSLLVLEDVDLVFSEREINPHSTSLGDMLDELDGFESDDAITVVLTTNAIERVERAVKDRPGRIGQCVYMAPPNGELRRRYLERFLRDCDGQDVDLSAVVKATQGASQAFLKEMVFRAIQVAVEREVRPNGSQLKLTTDDFLIAIEEMTSQTEKAAQSIIGLIG